MADALHIFVGSDRFQRDAGAERVLEYSIRKHATCPVEIYWMRAGDAPHWDVHENASKAGAWNLGRPTHLAWPKQGTGTPFSPFRFAIPEMMGFKGRAVYMDADMLVLGDVAELLNWPMRGGYTCCDPRRTDVSVIDCSWFKDQPWWPSIARMKPSGWRVFEYLQLMHAHKAIDASLPWVWNDCDGFIYRKDPASVRLEHYTDIRVQPYRPYIGVRYPDTYPHHPYAEIGHLWWDTLKESLQQQFGEEEGARLWCEARTESNQRKGAGVPCLH